MRIECQDAIVAVKQYLQSDIVYPFFVAANASSDIASIYAAVPDYVVPIRVSDYCGKDSMPDEDALYEKMTNAASALLIKGIGDAGLLFDNSAFLRRIAEQTFPQKVVVICRNQGVLLGKIQQQNTKFGDHRWCELTTGSDITIIKVKQNIGIDKTDGIKALLKKMEDCQSGKLYVSTDVPINSARVISSAYDAIRENNPAFVVPETSLADEQWQEYLENQDLSSDNPIHWRYYLRMMVQGAETAYFKMVLLYAHSYADYRTEILNAILHLLSLTIFA